MPEPPVQQLISLGDSSGTRRSDRGAERRVVLAGIVGAAGFVAAAALLWLSRPGGGIWMPLHVVLAGGASLAIGALLPHFSVSLAASRPAPARWRYAGLGLLGFGSLAAVAGFDAEAPAMAVAGGTAFLAGLLVTLATALLPLRAGVGRRPGVIEVGYAVALVNAVAAVCIAALRLGGLVGPAGEWLALKPAHAWLNLLGFLSLVVATTLIHLYPTVLGARIRPSTALLVLVIGIGLGAPLVALGYALGNDSLVRLGAVAVSAGALALTLVALRAWPGRGRWTTDPAWHRLTIGHLSAGIGWLLIGSGVLTVGALAHGADPGGWSINGLVGPLIVGWTLQVLVGSWSHLLPAVGPGGPDRHAVQRRELGRWSIVRLLAWNLGAALISVDALRGGWPGVAGAVLLAGALLVSLTLLLRALLTRGLAASGALHA